MNNIFFAMKNNHIKQCGEPNYVTNDDPKKYYGYFENEHGEQWVFVYNHESEIAELYGGDIGWDEVVQIQEGQPNDLILSKEEMMWLQACWKAARAFSKK